ncbi:SDR family NAD(P)-dependent oxidoreductase [Xanthomonas arboricola]|uniref:SDR family NAD(P)-dependent oxidoreductase n=1 Tax=Xanthomonas arboricola TaxID=56448 RepID=UPI000E1E53EB|nr:SDR family oxidoreductase [Xanthomonas arboricola]
MTTTLITGASSGIGAVYARRFAARGPPLVLVARATDRLDALAAQLRAEHAVTVEVITADLTDAAQLHSVTQRISDSPIDILVNNAGASLSGGLVHADPAALEQLLRLNALVPTLLARAALPSMLERGHGAMINIASALALLPEYSPGIYAATKAYVLALSQSLHMEVGNRGIQLQAVLPAATRTEIYTRAGMDISRVPDVMDVDALVDAALVGFDRKELVTIPPLPDAADWDAFEQARMTLAKGFSHAEPAARYRA